MSCRMSPFRFKSGGTVFFTMLLRPNNMHLVFLVLIVNFDGSEYKMGDEKCSFGKWIYV